MRRSQGYGKRGIWKEGFRERVGECEGRKEGDRGTKGGERARGKERSRGKKGQEAVRERRR